MHKAPDAVSSHGHALRVSRQAHKVLANDAERVSRDHKGQVRRVGKCTRLSHIYSLGHGSVPWHSHTKCTRTLATKGGRGRRTWYKTMLVCETVIAGSQHILFPDICEEMGWDKAKLCGPVIMNAGGFPEGNCCFGHPAGSPLHTPPMVKGKAFALADHKERLQSLGLTVQRKELAAMREAGGKPTGVPKKIGNALIYPVQHFA